MARTDVVSQEVPGSPATVYAALTDPIALAAWLPPDGMTGTIERFDASPGGGYRMILRYDDDGTGPTAVGKAGDGSDVVEVRFVDLVPGERLVEQIEFVSADPAYAGTMTMTWSITARRGGCTVELRAEGVPPGISAADHLAGMGASLRNLGEHLAMTTDP